MPENVSLVVAGRTAISDSRRNDSRYRLAILRRPNTGDTVSCPLPISVAAWFDACEFWPRVVSGGRGLVGEARTQGKSRVSHRPLRQGRHAGRCGAAGARTVRARAVVACASVLPPDSLRA